MDFEDFVALVLFCLVIFLLVWVISFAIYKYTVEIAEANILKVYVNGELVYEGKKAFILINSGGMTTTVTIYKKLYPFTITDKVYSEKDIEVKN